MARTACNPFVGQIVYRVCRPLNPGRIEAVIPSVKSGAYRPRPEVRVTWKNGTQETVSGLQLMDFAALVDDHRKKLLTHVKNLKELQAKLDDNALGNGVPR